MDAVCYSGPGTVNAAVPCMRWKKRSTLHVYRRNTPDATRRRTSRCDRRSDPGITKSESANGQEYTITERPDLP